MKMVDTKSTSEGLSSEVDYINNRLDWLNIGVDAKVKFNFRVMQDISGFWKKIIKVWK